MSDTAQTYATHRRLDPIYHYVGFGIWCVLFIYSVIHLVRHPSCAAGMVLLAAILLFITFLLVRTYALKVQDRLIRLEETLRMERLLSEAQRARIGELNLRQFVALRFASDEELPALMEQALVENLDGEAIKKRIKTWRPDNTRV